MKRKQLETLNGRTRETRAESQKEPPMSKSKKPKELECVTLNRDDDANYTLLIPQEFEKAVRDASGIWAPQDYPLEVKIDRLKVLKVTKKLREAGIEVDTSYYESSIKGILRRASEEIEKIRAILKSSRIDAYGLYQLFLLLDAAALRDRRPPRDDAGSSTLGTQRIYLMAPVVIAITGAFRIEQGGIKLRGSL